MTYDVRQKIGLLADKARQVRLEALGLPSRATNILKSKGISDSHEAMVYVVDHFDAEKGVGAKTLAEVRRAVRTFLGRLESLDQESLDTLSDPREEFFGTTNGNLVKAFPGIVELYHSHRSGSNRDRNLDIIRKRFGLDGSAIYTLEELGTYYDVSRVRIQQIEAKTVREVGGLLSGTLNIKGWRLSKRITESYLAFRSKLGASPLLITKPKLDLILEQLYGLTLELGYLSFLMEVSGYVKLSSRIGGFRGSIIESWRERSGHKRKDIEAVFRSFNTLFDCSEPCSIFELAVAAKKRSKSKVSNEDIEVALGAVADFEKQGDQSILRFASLRSTADKAFRVLQAQGSPLHYSKIAFEINVLSKDRADFRPAKEKTLTAQMSADCRFMPIGKSGKWGLATWTQSQNVTIVEAIQQVLHKSGKPLKYSVLLEAVRTMRPGASSGSIRIYLNDASLFTRVSPGVFGLKSWRLSPTVRSLKKAIVPKNAFVAAVKFALALENPVPLPRAVALISGRTKLPEATIHQRLAELEAVELRNVEGSRQREVYCGDLASLSPLATKDRKLLRERVQDEIRSVLYEQPNEPIKKVDLFRLISRKVTCIRPTFYQYLKRMDDIHQYRKGSEYFAVYRSQERKQAIRVNLEQYFPSKELVGKLSRPISKLTIEEVDIALYELGLQFENTLRKYLATFRSKRERRVFRKDLGKLTNMIDYVVREGIVSKRHHLDTLREERNKRAHGEVPSKEEREVLFNKAHYIADLFVRYICWFDNEARKL